MISCPSQRQHWDPEREHEADAVADGKVLQACTAYTRLEVLDCVLSAAAAGMAHTANSVQHTGLPW